MTSSRRSVLSRSFAALAVLLPASDCSSPAEREPEVRAIPWAWERPEDLSFLPQGSRVAYLAATVSLEAGQLRVIPRQHPLHVPPAARLLPVVRIETRAGPAELGVETVERIAAIGVELATGVDAIGVQIDFDATRSQRSFYRRLLAQLRADLPPDRMLSVAALASWCVGDRWLAASGVDEVVPMLYRMGPEAGVIRARLDAGYDFPAPYCRAAVGISTDEPTPSLPSPRQVYLFSAARWTAEGWSAELATLSGRLRR